MRATEFGVSWQIVPSVLMALINDPAPERSSRVMEAMLHMTKIDIAELKAAHEGWPSTAGRVARGFANRPRYAMCNRRVERMPLRMIAARAPDVPP